MKKILSLIFFCLISTLPTFAEKMDIKITPTQIISTKNNGIDFGDWIKFETVEDIFLNNKIYIKNGTEVLGFVDYVQPNGFLFDYASIKFTKFVLKNTYGQKIKIKSNLLIYGKDILPENIFLKGLIQIPRFFRGAEIYIEPDEKVFMIKFLQES